MAGISLGSNISSLQTQRRLNDATAHAGRVYERLSSGQRINRASDDAAGLAITSDLSARSRVYGQAGRNVQDGFSALAIADATVENLSGIVIRIRELSEQSANGTFSNKQRRALDAEAQALSKEFLRVARTASFNGLSLFDGSLENGLRLQLGYGTDGSLHSTLGGELGTGSFRAVASYQTGGSYTFNAIALGDLNGDGVLDFAGVDNGGFASIRIGRGDGTFGTSQDYTAALGSSLDVALGDLNGDRVLDLVTSGGGSGGEVLVSLGNGNGTFGEAAAYAAETTYSHAGTLGDLNGDGNLDLVSSGFGPGGGEATIRLGNGNGTFGAATRYQAEGTTSYAASLGDLNGDGVLDLVTAGSGAGGRATIRLGNGDGSFKTAVSYTMETSASLSLTLGDLNGDGVMDLVSSGVAGGFAYATTRLGNGDGTFRAALSYLTGNGSGYAIALGDLNGDGSLDLVSGGTLTGGQATVRFGNGDGTFRAVHSYLTGEDQTDAIALGDLDGDGVLDIVSSGYDFDNNSGETSTLLAVTRDGISPILSFSLATKFGSLTAMGMLDRTLQNLAKQRGTIGAFQSRLSSALATIVTSRENFTAGAARIKDADIAQESAALVRSQILQQAGAAVLSQANQAPSLALQLLR